MLPNIAAVYNRTSDSEVCRITASYVLAVFIFKI